MQATQTQAAEPRSARAPFAMATRKGDDSIPDPVPDYPAPQPGEDGGDESSAQPGADGEDDKH